MGGVISDCSFEAIVKKARTKQNKLFLVHFGLNNFCSVKTFVCCDIDYLALNDGESASSFIVCNHSHDDVVL